MRFAIRIARIGLKLVKLIGLLALTRCFGPDSAACILHGLESLGKGFSLRAERHDGSVETTASSEI